MPFTSSKWDADKRVAKTMPSTVVTHGYTHDGLIRPYETELRFLGRLADIATIPVALWVAMSVSGESWRNIHSLASVIGGVLFYLVGHATGLHRWVRGARLAEQIRNVWITCAVAFMLMILVAFVTKTSADFSRQVVILWALLAPVGISVWRLVLELAVLEVRTRGYNSRSAAIVGASPLGVQLAKRIAAAPWTGLRLVGFYDDRGLDRLEAGVPLQWDFCGNFDRLVEESRKGVIDEVYIALPPRAEPRIADLIRRLSDTTASVHLAYDFGGFDLLRADWSNIEGIPVMSVVEHPFHGVDGVIKRIEDLVLGSVILTLLSPLMLLIALGVKLSSRGPVFFRQRRYGLNGEEIRVLKFRTMTCCEDGPVVRQAQKGDARITRMGALLRRTSMDELPQFLQVVTGTMSIVGPRPHAVAHNEEYRAQIQGYMLRHKVKPGITGWAQVHGWRGETDSLDKMQKRVDYDLEYIRRWALALDLQIVVMTVRQVLGHRNAY